MINILYIGNNLKNNRSNISAIQTLGNLFEGEGYNVSYASSINSIALRLLDMLYSCFKYRKKTDIVLIDTYSTLNFYYAFFVSQWCRFLGLKYMPLLHGGNLENRLKNNPYLSKIIFKNAKQNISPSLFLQEKFNAYGYDNVTFIPNAIHMNNYVVKEPNFKDGIKMLWVRSFSEIYNPILAVKVLKKIRDLGYDSELCMVGPDSDGTLERVKDLAKNLELNVTFTGKLPKPEWISLASYYNIFINTTNFDNAPVSVIEAMALGFPIVSTNVGGLPYLITNNQDGLLVEKNDLDGMVDAVLKISNDTIFAKKLTVNARKKSEHFDWQVVKEQWASMLH